MLSGGAAAGLLVVHGGQFVLKVGQVDCQGAVGDKFLALVVGGQRGKCHSRFLLLARAAAALLPFLQFGVARTIARLGSGRGIAACLLDLLRGGATTFANMVGIGCKGSVEGVVEAEVEVRLDAIFVALFGEGWLGQRCCLLLRSGL